MNNKEPQKARLVIFILLLIIISVILIFLIPIIINELYKLNDGYETLWEAKDVLSFYSVILSGLITFIALFITIKHNNKNIEKQNILNLSQIKQPFFIIENVAHYGCEVDFRCNDYGNWCKTIKVGNPCEIKGSDLNPIVIEIKNIGDGIALSSQYSVSMFSSRSSLDNIIKSEKISTILYDFELNLNDEFVKPIIFANKKEDSSLLCTYLNIQYCNTTGVRYQQTIEINLIRDYSKETLSIIINEISPQTIDIKTLHF